MHIGGDDILQLKLAEIAVIAAVSTPVSAGKASACRREPGIPLVDIPVPVGGAAGGETAQGREDRGDQV